MNSELKELETVAVENFRRYLRIPTVHPNVDYEPCVVFLKEIADDIGLEFVVFRDVPKNPMVVMTWTGKEPNLPTIMLNSHMDVVPVYEDKWSYKPFDADIDEEGNIYARGAQDTKSTGIQYLEAIRRLKKDGFQPRRTIHVTFLPDEELGGSDGLKKYIVTDNFKKLNIGFALDEGGGGTGNTLVVFYGEKQPWKFAVHCPGQTGHGSLLLKDTAGEKVRAILNKFYNFRAEQKEKEKRDGHAENATSVNLTMMRGGVQNNVIPNEFVLVFDSRVPAQDYVTFEEKLTEWCKDSGRGVWIENIMKAQFSPNTKTDDTNIFWVAFERAAKEMGYNISLQILHAGTDARNLRVASIPAFGFGVKQDTPSREHSHDEFLNVNVFLNGIKIYAKIISAISNA